MTEPACARIRSLYAIPAEDGDLWECGVVLSQPASAASWVKLKRPAATSLPGYWRSLCELLFVAFGNDWFTVKQAARKMQRSAGVATGKLRKLTYVTDEQRRHLFDVGTFRIERETEGRRRFRMMHDGTVEWPRCG